MDCVVGLPRALNQYDPIWIIVNWITKSDHFIHTKYTFLLRDYARIYIDKIVSLHGVSFSIIKDRTLNLARGFGYLSKRFGYSIEFKHRF